MLESIGIIPDGNRRYADKKDITYEEAYQQGFEKGEEVFEWCIQHPTIKKAVVYALSTENVARKSSELDTLFTLYKENLEKLAEDPQIHRNNVNVELIGRQKHLEPLEEQVNKLEKETGNYDNYELKIALGYGGRAEIIDAARKITRKDEELTEENFKKELYSSSDLDLVVRTGKYQRLSNFQLWQSAYAELYFSDKLWPEFDKQEFDRAVEFYEDTKRKFGK